MLWICILYILHIGAPRPSAMLIESEADSGLSVSGVLEKDKQSPSCCNKLPLAPANLSPLPPSKHCKFDA